MKDFQKTKSNTYSDISSRFIFTLFMLVIYRLGTYISLPSVDSSALFAFASSQSAGILGMFNMFAGGALERLSIFSLNIMPYITASIIMQLVGVSFKDIIDLKKEGERGRKKLGFYTKCLTIILALFQGYGLAVGAEQATSSLGNIVINPGLAFKLTAMFTLMGGTMFVMWLGEQITARGLGNGSSIIIFCGIVSGLPSAIATFLDLGKTGAIPTYVILFIMIIGLGMVATIVFIERAHRKILVQYQKRQIGNKIYKSDSTHLPLKINTSGVIPPIFANAMLSFPATLVAFSASSDNYFADFISSYMSHGKPLYIALYVVLIAFFSFFYSSVVFNSEETADSLRKNGGVVLGKRPGKDTAAFFDYVISRLTVLGICYISAICIIPELIISKYSVPFYLGGTSLMIVVNVVIDMFSQIQTRMVTSQYSGLLKKSRIQRI